MENLYWAIEFVRVLIAYFFIMYLWPSVVFKKHLKKRKSRTYKFAFCSVVQLIVINTAVLGLGLINILSSFTFNLFFYGTFLYFLFKDVKIEKQTLLKGKYLISGTYGLKSLFSDLSRFIKKKLSAVRRSFLEYMSGHWFEYSILLILVIFGVIYFSMNAFQENSYGFGDLYTHHSWIHELVNGHIFAGNVYPEAMHCLIAVEYFSFGLTIYNALLFTGPVFSAIIIVSIYIMFKELFKWKHTPMIALALVLILDVRNSYAVSSMSRWQWTMPQEYGFPAMFFCVTYVLRYFKNGVFLQKIKRKPIFLRDDDLFIFVFSLASTIAAHFYATIMAFLLCVAAAVVLIRKFFTKKFLPFIVACIAGVLIGMGPMLGALAEGYHFQGSIRWAMSLILSKEQFEALYGGDEEEEEQAEEKSKKTKQEGNGTGKTSSSSGDKGTSKTDTKKNDSSAQSKTGENESGDDSSRIGTVATALTAEGLTNIVLGASNPEIKEKESFIDVLSKNLNLLWVSGYSGLHKEERGKQIVILSLGSLAVWLILRLFILVRRKMIANYKYKGDEFDGYVVIVLASLICTFVYAMPSFRLPELLEKYRICAVAHVMSVALYAVPIDLLGEFIISRFKEKLAMAIAFIMVVGVYITAKLTGSFRGYLVIELTRYNSSVLVTNAITSKMGRGNNNFTIVSTTDELYPVLGYGYHEELISFINNSEVVSYTIPTEYIFIMLEKNPIKRAQHHMANGPSWIAENKHEKQFGGCSTYPEVKNMTISEDYANIFFGKFPYSSTVYNTLWQRVLLNSKAYVWCQKFNAMYPNELHTFYEDENILVYYLRQNPRNLYELATMDPSVMIPPEDYDKPIWPEKYKNAMEPEEEEEEGEESGET